MVEFCPDHTNLVKSVGEIKGTVTMILSGQQQMIEDISAIRQSAVDTEKDAAVEKTKVRPIFWIIAAAGMVLIDTLIRAFLK